MNVPVDLIVFLGGGNMALLTICAHILLNTSRDLNRMDKRLGIIEDRYRNRFNIRHDGQQPQEN